MFRPSVLVSGTFGMFPWWRDSEQITVFTQYFLKNLKWCSGSASFSAERIMKSEMSEYGVGWDFPARLQSPFCTTCHTAILSHAAAAVKKAQSAK
jgi:hypothetical protein